MSASLSLLIHPQSSVKTEEAWCFDENYLPTYPGIATHETAFYEETLELLERSWQFATSEEHKGESI